VSYVKLEVKKKLGMNIQSTLVLPDKMSSEDEESESEDVDGGHIA
jgi:hypothetical protein